MSIWLVKNKVKVLLIMFVFQSIQLGFAQSGNTSIIEKIQQRGYLIVGMTASDQYPFYYINSLGKFDGLDVDIAKKVASKLEVDIQYNREARSFNGLIPLVVNRDIDFVVSKLSRTLARAKLVNYTEPYIIFRQALLLNRIKLAQAGISEHKIPTLLANNFTGDIGVIENSSYERYAKINFPSANVISYHTWEQVVEAGITGQLFSVYRDELEILKVIKENPSSNLTLKPVVLSDQTDPIAIAVHPAEHHFLAYLNIVLDEMYIEKDIKKLLTLYKQ